MTELYINGFRVDIEPGQIRQTFQNNSLGSVKDRQLSYTNTFKALSTGRNQRFFGHLNEINNQSDKPYRLLPAKIVEDGLEVTTGSAYIKKGLEIHIYSGINNLYESINNKSIRDLDWSSLNHTITENLVTNSFDESLGYIYSLANYSNKTNQQAYLDTWLPSAYEWWIWQQIFIEAGFEFEGDIFETDEFKETIINPTTFEGEDMLERDFAKFMPDILQTEFVREVLVRYGLMFEKVRGENKYIFKQLKEVFRDRAGAADWSNKIVSVSEPEYTLGKYGTKNYFRYKDQDGYTGNADGFFELDIDNLPQEVTVHESVYIANQKISVFDTLNLPIFEYDDNDDIDFAEIEPSISTIVKEAGTFQFQSESGGFGSVFNGDVPYLRFNNLEFSRFTLANYFELKQVANRAKVIEATLYLNPIDIYNLTFLRLVYIKQMASYFYLNKISNFRSGSPCEAELVRIPPNVFSGQESSNTAPTVELFVNPMTTEEDTEVIFTHNIQDAEGNIETWSLTFGNGQQLSGFGYPQSSIPFTYTSSGTYTATLTVTDFEGLTASDSITVNVTDTFVTTFDNNTGEYNAPSGSTVVATITAGGASSCSATMRVGTTALGNDIGARVVNYQQQDFVNSKQLTFQMPSNGTVFFSAEWSVGENGPAPGFANVEINNNGEIFSFSVSYTNTEFP